MVITRLYVNGIAGDTFTVGASVPTFTTESGHKDKIIKEIKRFDDNEFGIILEDGSRMLVHTNKFIVYEESSKK